MPKTTALASFVHPTTGEPVAAGAEVALKDEDYYALRSAGVVAATPAEWAEHQSADAKGNYAARTTREDVASTKTEQPQEEKKK
jgi:hypothetical protein